ncbi:glycine betaine ABC transporter substrate-binding protein [Allonocardiopsis opalescens]|nr:glycine betaine ABC transporter substrate-binding protein [Allonocardiopsis opalescens]
MGTNNRRLRGAGAAAGLMSLALLAACGGGGGVATGPEEGGASGAAEGQEITIGWIPWEEDIAVTHLWAAVLADQGYTVELTNPDVAPLYQGLAGGDIDLFLDTWLPDTHADYWEQYGEQLEDIGVWYDNAVLTMTVPSYVEGVESIEDLADNADMFGGRIVGIESGSGLNRTIREEAIPTYGLDDYEFVESSTSAMLAELDSAIAAEEPIVVGLWRPHIAYANYDLRDLEDPEGAMGAGEEIHMVGRQGFAADYPELNGWLQNFTLNDEELQSLETLVLQEHEDDPEAGARAWLAENPDFLERVGVPAA